jgi:hypothetical protein
VLPLEDVNRAIRILSERCVRLGNIDTPEVHQYRRTNSRLRSRLKPYSRRLAIQSLTLETLAMEGFSSKRAVLSQVEIS